MESIQPKKNKTNLLKIFFAIIFFPFTISYLILKQKQLPLIGRIAVVALFWIVFMIIGSSGSKSSSNTITQDGTTQQTTNTPAPTEVAITMEQKQADFKDLYKKYKIQSQGMLAYVTSIQQISNLATGKADLFLALDKIEKNLGNIANANLDVDVPKSLKEYKQISDALMDFKIAGTNFTDAVKKMKEYVNKEDLEKLAQAKDVLERGVARLGTSKDKMDAVAKELNVDITQIKGIE